MAHSSVSRSLLGLARTFKQLHVEDPLTECLAPRLSRSFASQAQLPISDLAQQMKTQNDSSRIRAPETTNFAAPGLSTSASSGELHALEHPVLATCYQWPQIEPFRYALFNPKYLDAPLRRDILHRAVIYEADMTRQGTASTKWRADVHGSNRKIQAQKGTGRARVRDRKSPIRRGGGVAFGPKPRDFSTELPGQIYQLAFRTALSYRLRRNELIILDNEIQLPEENSARFLNNLFEENQWGKGHGRSLLVTATPKSENARIFDVMETVGEHAELKDLQDVDVKDLLMSGRVVVERTALLKLLCQGHFVEDPARRRSYVVKSRDHPQMAPEQIVQYL